MRVSVQLSLSLPPPLSSLLPLSSGVAAPASSSARALSGKHRRAGRRPARRARAGRADAGAAVAHWA